MKPVRSLVAASSSPPSPSPAPRRWPSPRPPAPARAPPRRPRRRAADQPGAPRLPHRDGHAAGAGGPHHLPARRGTRDRRALGVRRRPPRRRLRAGRRRPVRRRHRHLGTGRRTTPTTSSRAAVVYLRHWRRPATGTAARRPTSSCAGSPTCRPSTGPNAGNVVLWMQPDGTLNPSAEPVELPDPSDSGPSYWLARTIWALGEGYAAFRHADPAFAAFLKARLDLADRRARPAGARAVRAVPDRRRRTGARLADRRRRRRERRGGAGAGRVRAGPAGRARPAPRWPGSPRASRPLGGGDADTWPYGAVLPWALSRSFWHAWGAQMPSALAAAATALHDQRLLRPAVADAAAFTPAAADRDRAGQRLAARAGRRHPDRVRRRRPRAVAAGGRPGRRLGRAPAARRVSRPAGTSAQNPGGAAMYDPATGVTYDGVAARRRRSTATPAPSRRSTACCRCSRSTRRRTSPRSPGPAAWSRCGTVSGSSRRNRAR